MHPNVDAPGGFLCRGIEKNAEKNGRYSSVNLKKNAKIFKTRVQIKELKNSPHNHTGT